MQHILHAGTTARSCATRWTWWSSARGTATGARRAGCRPFCSLPGTLRPSSSSPSAAACPASPISSMPRCAEDGRVVLVDMRQWVARGRAAALPAGHPHFHSAQLGPTLRAKVRPLSRGLVAAGPSGKSLPECVGNKLYLYLIKRQCGCAATRCGPPLCAYASALR